MPEIKTIWPYRNLLSMTGLMEEVFHSFFSTLEDKGLLLKEGVIVDSTLKEVPRPQLSQTEQQGIKRGGLSAFRMDNVNSLRQTDRDATLIKKHKHSYFSYKNYVVLNAARKFIVAYNVNDASVADVNVFEQ